MPPSDHSPMRRALARLASMTPALEFLLLFGSRARGDAHDRSDWDFGYQAAEEMGAAALLASIVETVGTDRVDLVDLRRAGGLLRYRAARDGVVIYEARPRLAERFRLEAADFWCDAGPILRQGYDDALARLER